MIELLHAASRWFENFSDRHQHGIALLEAISTTAAVIVALWSTHVARGASKPKLRARVSVMQVFGNDTDLEAIPTYIAVRLTNTGSVPIRLHSTCFSWRLPSAKTSWAALPLDENGDENIGGHRYPFVLLPNTSDTLFLTSIQRFRKEMPRILGSEKLSAAQGANKLRGYVYTDDGSLFRVVVDGDVRKEIAAIGEASPTAATEPQNP